MSKSPQPYGDAKPLGLYFTEDECRVCARCRAILKDGERHAQIEGRACRSVWVAVQTVDGVAARSQSGELIAGARIE